MQSRARILFSGCVLLCVAAVALAMWKREQVPSSDSAQATLDLSQDSKHIRLVLRAVGSDAAQVARSLRAPMCRYVVIYSSTCGACRRLARRWEKLWAKDASALPVDWQLLIIVDGQLLADDPIAQTGFPFPVTVTDDGDLLTDLVGITATPAHVILNRAGEVQSAAVLAELWKPAAYHSDCTVGAAGDSV